MFKLTNDTRFSGWIRKHSAISREFEDEFTKVNTCISEFVRSAYPEWPEGELLKTALEGHSFLVPGDIPSLYVPRAEFRQLVFQLPSFDSLPILWLGMKYIDNRSEVYHIIDIDSNDDILINANGYPYPRYKGAIIKNVDTSPDHIASKRK